jgi:hypothetical protein
MDSISKDIIWKRKYPKNVFLLSIKLITYGKNITIKLSILLYQDNHAIFHFLNRIFIKKY